MAENPTNLPKHGAELEPRAYIIAIQFHPPISLSKNGYKFAADISDYLEARTLSLQPHQWQLSQPLGSGLMQLTVGPELIQFEVGQPEHAIGWIADRCRMVLETFHDTFKPKVMLVAAAKVVGTMQIDGDARLFLAKHVSSLDTKRFTMLNRPIHIFGIRVTCPPYKKEQKKGKKKVVVAQAPWNVDIKAESWAEDPTKLWLEADAQWPGPFPWDASNIKEAVSHLQLVKDYLAQDVMQFLQNPVPGDTQ